MADEEKAQPVNPENTEEKKETKAEAAEKKSKPKEEKAKAPAKQEEKAEKKEAMAAPVSAEEKRKKVTRMNLAEVEHELKQVKEKMGGFNSRYAQDLLGRKKILS